MGFKVVSGLTENLTLLNPALPMGIIILFLLTTLVIIASIIFTCSTYFYVGSQNPKLRKAVSVRVNQNSQSQLTIPNALDHSGQTSFGLEY
jgi:hypothetical protein